VLNAGGLSRDEAFEAYLALEPRDVLSRLVSHTRDRIGVRNDVPEPAAQRFSLASEQTLWRSFLLRGMIHKLHDLAFRNAANLVQMQAAFALCFLRICARPKKSVKQNANTGQNGGDYSKKGFPVGQKAFQPSAPP